jgi:glucokinase
VVDIGGTNTRVGVSSGPGDISDVKVYRTGERHAFDDVLSSYIAELGAGPPAGWCTDAYVAAAGAVDNGNVTLTNAPWRISAQEVSRALGNCPVHFFNDLEAVGMLLPHLLPDDITPIGEPAATDLVGNRIAVNVGTGFGAATAVRTGQGGWTVAASEAGHMSFGLPRFDPDISLSWHDTIEDVLSGRGVVRLYQAMAETAGVAMPDATELDASRTAEAVFARSRIDPVAADTVRVLSRLIGEVAGNLVLATSAWDGAFLCGSVARAWLKVGDIAAFRTAFQRKGSMSERMSHVPTYSIATNEPALLGLTYGDLKAVDL